MTFESIPCDRETWDEVKGKAKHYCTARIIATDEWVNLMGHTPSGEFWIRRINGKTAFMHYDELTNFIL